MPIVIFIILQYDIIFICTRLWHNFVIKNRKVYNNIYLYIYMIGYSTKTYYLDLTIEYIGTIYICTYTLIYIPIKYKVLIKYS